MFTGCTVNLWAIWLPKCVTEKPTRATEVSFGVIFSKKSNGLFDSQRRLSCQNA